MVPMPLQQFTFNLCLCPHKIIIDGYVSQSWLEMAFSQQIFNGSQVEISPLGCPHNTFISCMLSASKYMHTCNVMFTCLCTSAHSSGEISNFAPGQKKLSKAIQLTQMIANWGWCFAIQLCNILADIRFSMEFFIMLDDIIQLKVGSTQTAKFEWPQQQQQKFFQQFSSVIFV